MGDMAEVETHGTGEVERLADRARLAVFYAEQAKDRATAVNALSARIGAVESVLSRDGVQARDRQLSVQIMWDGKRRSGFRATQSYGVRVTDLSALDELIADLVGTEPAGLHGPSWELADRDEAMREAQRAAVADARRRAAAYAQALGLRLGPLLRVTDAAGVPPVRYGATMSRTMSATTARPVTGAEIAELALEPEAITVATSCTMIWQLVGEG
jgi:uncharacterized protein YggE